MGLNNKLRDVVLHSKYVKITLIVPYDESGSLSHPSDWDWADLLDEPDVEVESWTDHSEG